MTRRPDQDERCAHESSCTSRAIHVVDDVALCARHGVEALEARVLRVRQNLIALGVQARVGEGHLIARGRNLARDDARQLLAQLHELLEDYPEPVEALLCFSEALCVDSAPTPRLRSRPVAHTTFRQMMNEVVAFGSCCECGTCVLVCPHNVIDYVDGKPKQVAKATAAFDYCGISEGIGCDVCAQVCPRLGVREFDLRDAVLPREPGVHEEVFGRYRRIVAARCRDPEILARCQDGGVVTAILCHGLREGLFDGAVVSAADEGTPAAPKPRVVTTIADAIASASSWYTYCPNNLALADAERMGLRQVCFVGVPCQITPTRKIQLADPSFLDNGRKKEKHIERQTKFLKGFGENVVFTVGLLCTEVFTYEGLMVQKIQGEMGIPLADVRKFNVKGKVLVYKKDGEVVEMSLHRAQEYARPECHHCGDFSAELADVSCGGVACMDWTITILRTARGEQLFDDMVARGLLETRPMDEFENSMKVMIRLTKKQRERVPVPPGRTPRYVRPEGYPPSPADPRP